MSFKHDLNDANASTEPTVQPERGELENCSEVRASHSVSPLEHGHDESPALCNRFLPPRRFGPGRSEHRRLDDEFNTDVQAFMSRGRFVARSHVKSISKRVQVLRKMRLAIY